jgi:hypothetical protein
MGSLDMSADKRAVGPLEVTDNRYPGFTFTGTAQSVKEQMKRLEPKAFPVVDNVEIDQALSLRKRSSVILLGLNRLSLATYTDSVVNRLTVTGAITFPDQNLVMMATIT